MKMNEKAEKYFPYAIQVNRDAWEKFGLDPVALHMRSRPGAPAIVFYRHVANRLNREPDMQAKPVKAGNVYLYALLTRIFRYLLNQYTSVQTPGILDKILVDEGLDYQSGGLHGTLKGFAEHYPGSRVIEKAADPMDYVSTDDPGNLRKNMVIRELLLIGLSCWNPALNEFRRLFDDASLATATPSREVAKTFESGLDKAPPYDPLDISVMELLRLPVRFSPSSLAGQLEYIRTNWAALLPPELLSEIVLGMDILREEEREWWGGPGEPQVLEFGKAARFGKGAYDYPEYERFSMDADWMSNVVMISKMVYVWMDQLSKYYGRNIYRLDQIPDEELDRLADWGFNAVWLIGVWERSPASQKIKQLCGNPEAVSSAYSLYDYTIADDLGGQPALDNLKERAWRRGIRLASDMVPNHCGIYSRWTREHPDWFVQLDYPPYPAYSFSGQDLSFSPEISLFIEDGYWTQGDAAVVFKHVDNYSGKTRYIYHGNDGTSTPWNDTAQLNYLIPEVRETVIRTIIHVARNFPIIRFDAAMTLAKKHYQRLWYPQPGHGSGVPSRAEHGMSREEFDNVFPQEFWREVVDRIAVEAPDTLLLAEAFWLMEGYFVRTLGMHRVYNSAFMNMLKMEENAKYRQTIKNILEFNPEILKRFVNFMSNPDERTAIDQFGKEGKYIGAAVLLVTMPGLPMFGHGQIEGFTEKYGMEYRRAYWEEEIDRHLVAMHECRIFPLMKKRRLFSGSENFVLYDFFAGDGVDENVFAYSNRAGNEKAMIIYNNKYATTAGWIRTSAAAAAKDGDGRTVLVRKELAEALSFKPDGRHYYAFRDHASGMEYIRHGKELAENGMYVELEAYEYHAFLDFREIYDDDYGTWGVLCHKLQGRPVASLEEEVKQIRYASIIAPFAELCSKIAATSDTLYDPGVPTAEREENRAILRGSLTAFLAALAEQTAQPANVEAVAKRISRDLDFVGLLVSMDSQEKREKEAIGFAQARLQGEENGFNRFFLTLFLHLHRISGITDPGASVNFSASRFYEFGLSGNIETMLHSSRESRSTLESPWGSGTEAMLLGILLAHRSLFTARSGEGGQEPAIALTEDEKVRQFLLVHWSNDVEWFNRERFEDLVGWLYLADIIAFGAEAEDEKLFREKIAASYGLATDLIALAETARYRFDIFRSLLLSGKR